MQSQVESYQRLRKWYLILPCLTLSIIRYVSRVKWSNPGKEVALSPTPRCSSYSRQLIFNRLTGLVGRVFANGPGDLVSMLGRVIPKTLKMVLDTSLLNTQRYKVCIKGKVEQSRERSSALSYTLVL